MAGILKYSFHKSNICRRAFTLEHGVPPTMSDRVTDKWLRAQTPELGAGRAARVMWIAFPTDFLSSPTPDEPGTEICWIPAAPAAGATYVEIAYTVETQETVIRSFEDNDRRLIGYYSLATGEALIVNYYFADWVNSDLSVPGDGEVAELLFSASDPESTGRPIRITFGVAPKDGDAAAIQELGGYAIPIR